jgi:hypothetical protein
VSITTTSYEARFDWTMECNKSGQDAAQADLEAELFPKLVTIANEKFSEALNKETGHWYRIGRVVSKITNFKLLINYYGLRKYSVAGQTSVFFDSDISDPLAQHSPQLAESIMIAIYAIAAFISANATLFLLIVLVVAFTIGVATLINVGTGAIIQLGEHLGSLIITLAILGFGALAIYALFFTKRGRKATSKGYQLARRGYRAVRRRR